MLPMTNGILKYDPPRGNMKRKTEFWCVLNITNDFVKYYQDLIKREKFITLCEPAWGAHMSIIRGEKPTPDKMHLWKKYQNQKFDVTYDLDIKTAIDKRQPGEFYYVDAFSEELMNIRAEIGLPVYRTFHITIGRTYY